MKLLFALLLALPAFASSPFDIPQVQCRFVIVSLRDADCKSLNLEDLSKPKMLAPDDAAKLLKKLESCSGAQMLSAPQMTMLNEESGNCQMKQAVMLITGVTKHSGGQMIPKQEAVDTGLEIRCKPFVSDDNKTVRFAFQVTRTSLDPSVPLVPVTSYIKAVEEGGVQGAPIPFTVFIQPMVMLKDTMTDVLSIRDGHTAVVKLSRQPCKTNVVSKVPFLCDLPLIGDAFYFEETVSDFETTLVLMTPCVQPQMAMQPAPLMPQPPRPVDYTSLQSFEFHAPVYDPRPVTLAPPPLMTNIPYLSRLFVNPPAMQTCEPLPATLAQPIPGAPAVVKLPPILHPLNSPSPLVDWTAVHHAELICPKPCVVPVCGGCCELRSPLQVEFGCPVQTAAPVSPYPAPVTFAAPLPPVQCQPAPRKVQIGLGLTQPACGMQPHLEVPQVSPVKFAAPQVATPNPEILKILLEQYDVACKAGDTAKALTIAKYCLEMDPACFRRP